MQKVLFVVGVCVLGAFFFWETIKSQPMVDDLLLENVEALAGLEDDLWADLPIIDCIMYGDHKCPRSEVRVKYIVGSRSLGGDEDEETD